MRRIAVVLFAVLIGLSAAAAASAKPLVAGHENLEGQFAVGATGGFVEPLGQIGAEPNWSTRATTTGLDLRSGWNGSAHADFFATSFLSAGLWAATSDLRMRPQTIYLAGGPGTLYMLTRGRTQMIGLHVTGYLPGERSWTPYAFLGVARYFRKVNFSTGMLELSPGTKDLEVDDDRVGFDGGVGFEQPVNRWLGFTTCGHYFYSGALLHRLEWMGHDVRIDSWQFWSVDAGFTVHLPQLSAPR